MNECCCLTSTDTSRPIKDGDEWEKGDRRMKPRDRRQPGRPRLSWTARTIKCPSSIAQRPQNHATAVPTAMQNSDKGNVRSSAVGKQLKQKKSNSQAELHLPALDLFWANLWVQHLWVLLLISLGPAEASNFFVRVHLTSLLLISPGLCSLLFSLVRAPFVC